MYWEAEQAWRAWRDQDRARKCDPHFSLDLTSHCVFLASCCGVLCQQQPGKYSSLMSWVALTAFATHLRCTLADGYLQPIWDGMVCSSVGCKIGGWGTGGVQPPSYALIYLYI